MRGGCVVVVPVVRPAVVGDELASLRQCLRVLGSHDVRFLCSSGLDTAFYEAQCAETGVEFGKCTFGPQWFDGVEGYNRLCLNRRLYEAFAAWEYMLICQLDAWVFADRVDEWCARGYDYVGAPWLREGCSGVDDIGQWEVGNGGFSLRRVAAFAGLLGSKRKLRKPLRGVRRLMADGGGRARRNPLLLGWYALRAVGGGKKQHALLYPPQRAGGPHVRQVPVQRLAACADGGRGVGFRLRHAPRGVLAAQWGAAANGLPHVVQVWQRGFLVPDCLWRRGNWRGVKH